MRFLDAATALCGALGVVLGVTIWAYFASEPTITHAIGVVSECGIYAVLTVDSSGAVEAYDAAREAPAEIEAAVAALDSAARTTVWVPCPLPESFSEGPIA